MPELLGALVVWVPLLVLFVITPAYCAWLMWQRVQRTRRPKPQPYDSAYDRACEAVAELRGDEDARRDLRALLDR